MKRRTKAKHFGDNPNIRGKYGERKRINMAEPWERRHAGIKKSTAKVGSHMRKVPGTMRKVRVRGHMRKLR